MGRRVPQAVGALAIGLAGCSSSTPAPPAVCAAAPAQIERALAAAPGAVVLSGGVSLSQCVDRSRSGGELQDLGIVLTGAADDLAARAPRDAGAALRLGYLIGATRRGARHSPAVHAQLVRRLEQIALPSLASPRAQRTLRAGLAAGERLG